MSHPCPITRPIFEKHTTPYEPMHSFVHPSFVSLNKILLADKFIWHAVTRAVGNMKNQGGRANTTNMTARGPFHQRFLYWHLRPDRVC
ncbi:hypothetical protein FOT65_21730 [Citrobacter portucalensis]|nr:hypothetical protein [Citrobacter portucalensis]